MKNIDFLPARYSEQHALRRANLWHLVVFGVLVLVIGVSAASQYAARRAVEQELAAAASQRAESGTKYAQVSQLRQDLVAARDEALLYNYLRYPWPRTQLLAQVVRMLPESLSLTELRIVEENKGPPAEAKAAGQEFTAARRDFEQLRSHHDRRRTMITFSGLTQDTTALHAYVAQLAQCPLFEGAELESLESLSEDDFQSSTSSFLVRIMVVPGYGQPGGPSLDAAAKAITFRYPPSPTAARRGEKVAKYVQQRCSRQYGRRAAAPGLPRAAAG